MPRSSPRGSTSISLMAGWPPSTAELRRSSTPRSSPATPIKPPRHCRWPRTSDDRGAVAELDELAARPELVATMRRYLEQVACRSASSTRTATFRCTRTW